MAKARPGDNLLAFPNLWRNRTSTQILPGMFIANLRGMNKPTDQNNDRTLPHVATALIAKCAELAGLIEHLQNKVRQAVGGLNNVEETLRIFAPNVDIGYLSVRARCQLLTMPSEVLAVVAGPDDRDSNASPEAVANRRQMNVRFRSKADKFVLICINNRLSL